MLKTKARVLIVDDSALVRQILTEGLSKQAGIEVVGTAPDPFIARDKIVKLKPDVLTLDVEMPRMDGIEFLKHLMPQHPMPVIIVSSLTEKGKEVTIQALKAGAIDFVTKPSSQFGGQGLSEILKELTVKVKMASKVDVSQWKVETKAKPVKLLRTNKALAETTDKVVAIGASTGGTEALRKVINSLPRTFPGVVITQHMPPGFTKSFAASLDKTSEMEVREAKDGDRVMPGVALIAEGGKHLTVERRGGYYYAISKEGEKVSGHCPSVDVLLNSVAKAAGKNAVGAVLTGMGKDGAEGLLAMRTAGGRTMNQDEKTSVVYGMPKEAYNNGGSEAQVPIEDVSKLMMRYLKL